MIKQQCSKMCVPCEWIGRHQVHELPIGGMLRWWLLNKCCDRKLSSMCIYYTTSFDMWILIFCQLTPSNSLINMSSCCLLVNLWSSFDSNNFSFNFFQRVENVWIAVPHQHHYGGEMVQDTICAMPVAYTTKWTDKIDP